MEQTAVRREVTLLNLKWFADHLAKVFELKLTDAFRPPSSGTGGSSPRTTQSPRHIPSREKAAILSSPILKRFSLPSTPKRNRTSLSRLPNLAEARLIHLRTSTDEFERAAAINRFASHVCLTYEYQLGMLKGYKAVKAVVEFVAELIIRALQAGIIDDLQGSFCGLHPGLFFKPELYPASGSQYVKTSAVGVHADSLSWKIKDMFTHPGLRYNEVIGQGCHNLSIVTHCLMPYTAGGLETGNPDLYGFRNLLVLPAPPDNLSPSSDYLLQHFRLFHQDATTIQQNKVRPTCRHDTNNLILHIHKSTQPIFFVLYDRAEVMDHLVECQTFANFCVTNKLTPVMFVNRFVNDLSTSPCPEYFHNFNIFSVSTSVEQGTSNPIQECSQQKCGSRSAYDNPAFVC